MLGHIRSSAIPINLPKVVSIFPDDVQGAFSNAYLLVLDKLYGLGDRALAFGSRNDTVPVACDLVYTFRFCTIGYNKGFFQVKKGISNLLITHSFLIEDLVEDIPSVVVINRHYRAWVVRIAKVQSVAFQACLERN